MTHANTASLSSSLKVWLAAARPRTLALAVAGTGLGLFLAAADGSFHGLLAALTVLTAVLLQVLSNLANDYGDSLHGADSKQRVGPRRAVQSGLISRRTMRQAIAGVVTLTIISGLAMVWLAFGAQAILLALLFLLLGAAAIWAAIAYTASSRPYGYAGLGDLFVFIFFGLVAVAGSYFLQRQALPLDVLLPATSCGLFAVGVLNVNNIRDRESDRQAGKFSIPVRVGLQRARLYHWVLLLGGLGAALLYVALNFRSPWQLLFLLSAPLFVANGAAVARRSDAALLDPMLKQLSMSTLLFVLTFGLGQLLG
ncbi:MAG TPA: 1,4-dihydroxy-2-naphthoate polyprenyltransferase [Candidatus Sulfomarinibacteraceae bacterium]|nr:1,4-dihydroxy-2-naphthoate polyprenyltransferase [Candidatus Sulfomarinibacteraceae bacterium]